ncbi:MAG: DUF1800 domain-containing protein [Planctomycetes bacterium]|nr:DUF1800 domain-containing protein [Planctomycetota bacterium]
MSNPSAIAFLLALAAAPLCAQAPLVGQATDVAPAAPGWNAQRAEHLLNRASFGARPAEIDFAVRTGQREFVRLLLQGFVEPAEPFFLDPPVRPDRRELAAMDEKQRRDALERFRRDEREMLFAYSGWWIEQMVEAEHPLREKLVLFWHGYFTSSMRDVKNAEAMIRQNELFRRHALGNFGELLRAVLRDPAMLEYLDNNQNRKDKPNENLARELMELFTLGVGNYSEQDIKEAARALTGWRTQGGNEALYAARQHDNGKKTILGRTGRFDADDLVDILLEQPACPRWVAGRLLEHFEGRKPSEERLTEYATLLKNSKYELAPFFEKLLLDERFYAPELVGERIAGPVEYMVGSVRRLGVAVPPSLLWLAAGQLGQRLFDPPNVKGWEGGEAWITTSTLLARGNMAGMLLGVVRLEDVLKDDAFDAGDEPGMMGGEMAGAPMDGAMGGDSMSSGEMSGAPKTPRKPEKKVDLGPELTAMKRLLGTVYYPRINLTARLSRTGRSTDGEIIDFLADELLPIALTDESRSALVEFLASERRALDCDDGRLLGAGVKAEGVLRRLAHLILSMPEAQVS